MPTPTINKERCSSCDICIDICPVEVFSRAENKEVLISKPGECIGCRACEAQCPKSAIIIED